MSAVANVFKIGKDGKIIECVAGRLAVAVFRGYQAAKTSLFLSPKCYSTVKIQIYIWLI